VLVLAGGEGKRMGGEKPQRLLAGRPLLDFALDAARRSGRQIAIGVRSASQLALRNDAVLVLDEAEIPGPLASLAAGLKWAAANGAEQLQTFPCDAPFLPYDLSDRLDRRMALAAAPVALPASGGRLHPACALWSVSVLSSLSAYLATGRRSLMGLAEYAGFAIEDWGAPERDPFFNVNTQENLCTAERWLDQPHLE
jgi:molybdopterin-guanine dinucleotide biosynthesis protein A